MPKYRFSALVHTARPADDIKVHVMAGWENVQRVSVVNQGGPSLRYVSATFKAEDAREALSHARDLGRRLQYLAPADSFRLGGHSFEYWEKNLEPPTESEEEAEERGTAESLAAAGYYYDTVDQDAHYERFGRPAFPNEY